MDNLLNINFNLLKPFWAVYKTGGINKAAKLLDMAPPAVTYNIKQLEKQLGKKLFIAHKKGVDPTGDASTMFPLIESIFENLQKCNEQLYAINSGTIKVGLTTMHASFFFVKFTQEFRAKYPDIKLEFCHHPQHDYLEMLEKNEIDVAIHLLLREPTNQMHNFKLQQSPMTFFVTKKYAAEHGIGNEITLEQLTKLPLILFSLMKTRIVLTNLEGLYKTQFKVVEAPTTHAAFDMAMSGHGVGYFFDEYLDAQNNDQIMKLKIKDAPPPPVRAYDCAYMKKPSALVTLFVRELKQFFSLE